MMLQDMEARQADNSRDELAAKINVRRHTMMRRPAVRRNTAAEWGAALAGYNAHHRRASHFSAQACLLLRE